jgi:ABC-type glycerol-3-phosphate transport system permease component
VAAIAATGRPRRRAGGALRRISARTVLYVVLALIVIFNDLPLAWMVNTSIKPDSEIITWPPSFLPSHPTFQHYIDLFRTNYEGAIAVTTGGFGHYLLSSTIVTSVSTVVVVVLGTFGAYALVRFDFPFVSWLGEASLFAYMVPSILLLVPLVQIMYSLHLDNNLLSLILIYSTLLLPFALWTLRSYFQGISVELEQAAMVDGCTRFGAFARVVLPQAVPGIIAAAIFTFNAAWGEYLFASTLITDPNITTLSPGLLQLMPSSGVQQWGALMAASVVMSVPLLVLFVIFQQQLVGAWSGEGAVKG